MDSRGTKLVMSFVSTCSFKLYKREESLVVVQLFLGAADREWRPGGAPTND